MTPAARHGLTVHHVRRRLHQPRHREIGARHELQDAPMSPCPTPQRRPRTTIQSGKTGAARRSATRASRETVGAARGDAAWDLQERELQPKVAPQKVLCEDRERFVADQSRRTPCALCQVRRHVVVHALESPLHW
jgi:hypothetical protein